MYMDLWDKRWHCRKCGYTKDIISYGIHTTNCADEVTPFDYKTE